MSWSCGIVGLPNAGKSTLFKALTALDVTIENYPFSTIDPNRAIVPIPDSRLDALADLSKAEKVTPATIEVIDVAGLVQGASRGEGLGNQFLGNLRAVDLLIHVLAGFGDIAPSEGDFSTRLETVNIELGLADLESLTRRLQKLEPQLRLGEKAAKREAQLLRHAEDHLNKGLPLRCLELTGQEKEVLGELSLLTLKKMVYVLNLSENKLGSVNLSYFPQDSVVIPLCASLEAELIELPEDERETFLNAYGLSESKTLELLRECYRMLELITFFTIKGNETRAWVVPANIRAVEAAGKIHSDMKQGFINAEVVKWSDLINAGGITGAREKGLSRVEGRDYPVQDGEVIFVRFRN